MKGYIKTKTNLVGKITNQVSNNSKLIYTYEYPSYTATELNSNIYTYTEESESE